jgi:hypothetical protein
MSVLIAAGREQEDLKFIEIIRKSKRFIYGGRNEGKKIRIQLRIGTKRDGFVYTKIREVKEKTGEKRYMNTLVESMNIDNPLLDADTMEIPTSSDIHDGMATFSHDGKKMFFTRWTKNNNQIVSYIYMSRWEDKGWTKPVKARNH